jgi:hypothetical protein
MTHLRTHSEGGDAPLATKHFQEQTENRGTPRFVQDALRRNCLVVRGHSPKNGRQANLRVVRITDGYWVCPARNKRLMSAYFVENERTQPFFRSRLANIEELSRIHRLPITKSPKERVTDELIERWLA